MQAIATYLNDEEKGAETNVGPPLVHTAEDLHYFEVGTEVVPELAYLPEKPLASPRCFAQDLKGLNRRDEVLN